MFQLSPVDVCIDRKNQMYAKYYSYHIVSPLYSKILRIYIILVNPKLEYIIICSLTAMYFEVYILIYFNIKKLNIFFNNNLLENNGNNMCDVSKTFSNVSQNVFFSNLYDYVYEHQFN